MEVKGPRDRPRKLLNTPNLFHQEIPDRPEDCGQDRVMGCAGNAQMKLEVELVEGFDILKLSVHQEHQFFDVPQLFVAGTKGAEGRALRLEDFSRLDEFKDVGLAQEKHWPDGLHVGGRADPRDKSTLALLDLKNPHQTETLERLPEGGAAHTQLPGEFPFRGQFIAELQASSLDHRFDVIAHGIGETDLAYANGPVSQDLSPHAPQCTVVPIAVDSVAADSRLV